MISLEHVTRTYRSWRGKEIHALVDFSLEIRAGEVFGLAGPNGAGKSTLISLLLGFLGPTAGAIRVAGMDPRRYVETFGVGYLSELINIPPTWRVVHALERYALLSGVPKHALVSRVNEAIERLGLEEHRSKRVRQLSKGNLQRLGLAQALLSDHQLVVLDEPTHGLDPVWTQRFRDIVADMRRPERTILLASHNLDELARLADRVGIIDRGQLQRIVDVRATAGDIADGAPYRILVVRGAERIATHFPEAREVGPGEYELTGLSLDAINIGIAALISDGALIRAVFPLHSALEQHFREAVGARGTAQ